MRNLATENDQRTQNISSSGNQSIRDGHQEFLDTTRDIMKMPSNIRNVSITGHRGHGKSALSRFLNSSKRTDGSNPQIYYSREHAEKSGNRFLINFIDTPGDQDLASETIAALKITDGTLLTIDAIDGVRFHTEVALLCIVSERVKPVFFINGVDRSLFGVGYTKESLCQSLERIIKSVNDLISSFHTSTLWDTRVDPEQENVIFGSAVHGWGFTLRHSSKLQQLDLVGTNYKQDDLTQCTTPSLTSHIEPVRHSSITHILDQIYEIRTIAHSPSPTSLSALLEKIEVKLSQGELGQTGEALFRAIMRHVLPLEVCLFETIIQQLPSPLSAQSDRVEVLYEGPMNDECALGIKQCSPDAPLVVYVSRMIRVWRDAGADLKGNDDVIEFYALARVFSGTLRAGVPLRIQGPQYVPGKKDDLFVKPISEMFMFSNNSLNPIEDCTRGNIVLLSGISQFLKTGTLTSSENAHNIKSTNFSNFSIVCVAVDVQPLQITLLPKLIEGLRRVSREKLHINVSVSELGEHVVAGPTLDHVNAFLEELKQNIGIELKISEPFVPYCETVTTESSYTTLSKSPNKHNRIFAISCPLYADLTNALDGASSYGYTPHLRSNSPETRTRVLRDTFPGDFSNTKQVWCFGPGSVGSNVLVDATKGPKGPGYLSEIKPYCESAFKWATSEGVLCEEPMRGVCVRIVDLVLQGDVIRRGGGQVIPTLRRAVHGSSLRASPTLQEPMIKVEIECLQSTEAVVRDFIHTRRGKVSSDGQGLECQWRRSGSEYRVLRCALPASESFGLNEDIRNITNPNPASLTTVFWGWDTMDGSPLEEGRKLHTLVTRIRTRKGLMPEIPPLSKFIDKL